MTTSSPSPVWVEKAIKVLTVDEGYRAQPYKDTKGYWTIGVGHLIGKDIYKLTLPDTVIRELLLDDIGIAWDSVLRIFGEDKVATWCEVRQLAFLSLAFNLGGAKLAEFKRTIAAVCSDDWRLAAKHLSESLWAKQVGNRAGRLIHMVKTGELHEDYL